MNLTEILSQTKMRVFEVGDRVVHRTDLGSVFTISSFVYEGQEKKMCLSGAFGTYSAKHWIKTK